jgi:hypothetical protein
VLLPKETISSFVADLLEFLTEIDDLLIDANCIFEDGAMFYCFGCCQVDIEGGFLGLAAFVLAVEMAEEHVFLKELYVSVFCTCPTVLTGPWT